MKIRPIIALVVSVVFLLTASLAFAAEQYFVIKDKHGICKVIKAKDKTPQTVAGPFKNKDDAEKAKDKECPKKDKK